MSFGASLLIVFAWMNSFIASVEMRTRRLILTNDIRREFIRRHIVFSDTPRWSAAAATEWSFGSVSDMMISLPVIRIQGGKKSLLIATFLTKKIAGTKFGDQEEKWLSTFALVFAQLLLQLSSTLRFSVSREITDHIFFHFLLYSKFCSGVWFRVFAVDFADCASWSCTQKPCHTYNSGYLEILFILPYRMVCHHRLGLLCCSGKPVEYSLWLR